MRESNNRAMLLQQRSGVQTILSTYLRVTFMLKLYKEDYAFTDISMRSQQEIPLNE